MNEYMQLAYKESLKAFKKKEIPVGVIITKNNKVISKAHNDRQKKYSVLGHAEINAITKAEKKIKDWRLDGCEMYVTLYPCEMCEKIIKECRLSKVYYLLEKNQDSSSKHMFVTIHDDNLLNNYKKIIDKFFKELR